MSKTGIGASVHRVEDLRFLTGHGRYVDDIVLPRLAHVAFVPSPHAHARIVNIDTADALKIPSVLRVFTGVAIVTGCASILGIEDYGKKDDDSAGGSGGTSGDGSNLGGSGGSFAGSSGSGDKGGTGP